LLGQGIQDNIFVCQSQMHKDIHIYAQLNSQYVNMNRLLTQVEQRHLQL
jgi:hypothetical protein